MRACRKLEAEAEEKLQNVYAQLLQAGVDRNENEREKKLRETLASLQELFPGMYVHVTSCLMGSDDVLRTGVRGRMVDLCKPTAKKYEIAISVVLGRNIDAIVVDEERTAIDCIEVHFPPSSPIPLILIQLLLSTCGTSVQAKQHSFLSTRSK